MTGGSGAGGQMNKTCCGVVYDCSFFYLMQVCNEENSFPLPLNPNLEKDNLHALLLLTLTGHNCILWARGGLGEVVILQSPNEV